MNSTSKPAKSPKFAVNQFVRFTDDTDDKSYDAYIVSIDGQSWKKPSDRIYTIGFPGRDTQIVAHEAELSAKPKRTISANTRLRVIINGVMLHGVTPKKLEAMLGVTNQRYALDFAIAQFNRSDVAITGLLTSWGGVDTDRIDVQIDLQ